MKNITIGLHPPSFYPNKLMDDEKKVKNGVVEFSDVSISDVNDLSIPLKDSDSSKNGMCNMNFNITIGIVPPSPRSQIKPINSYEFDINNLSSISSYDFSHIHDQNTQSSMYKDSSITNCSNVSKSISEDDANITKQQSKTSETGGEQSKSTTTRSKQELMEICMSKMKIGNANVEYDYEALRSNESKHFDANNHQVSFNNNINSSCYDGNNNIQRHRSKYVLCKSFNSKLLKINNKHEDLSKRLEKLEININDFNSENSFNNYKAAYNSICLVGDIFSPTCKIVSNTPQLWMKCDDSITKRHDTSINAERYPTLWAIFNNKRNGITSTVNK